MCFLLPHPKSISDFISNWSDPKTKQKKNKRTKNANEISHYILPFLRCSSEVNKKNRLQKKKNVMKFFSFSSLVRHPSPFNKSMAVWLSGNPELDIDERIFNIIFNDGWKIGRNLWQYNRYYIITLQLQTQNILKVSKNWWIHCYASIDCTDWIIKWLYR